LLKYSFKTERKKGFETKYVIHEEATQQLIKIFTEATPAQKMYRHLKRGGAFDGWTPTFILKEVKK
jgi:hypothetical protein